MIIKIESLTKKLIYELFNIYLIIFHGSSKNCIYYSVKPANNFQPSTKDLLFLNLVFTAVLI
jgi:hypothetical protein